MAQRAELMRIQEWNTATVVLALIGQGAAIVWAVSGLVKDVESNASDIAAMNNRVADMESTAHHQAITMARIDANLEAIRDALDLMIAKK